LSAGSGVSRVHWEKWLRSNFVVGTAHHHHHHCNNNNNNKTCTLIDVAIPADRNVVRKEAEKKLKYNGLCIEMQRMWNLKCTIVPVIIGATGIVTRSLTKNLETIPGKHSIDPLQKTATLGTSHIIRKVLQCEA
jgi:hypothetical protein